MNSAPHTIFQLWQDERLFNIDFASYTLSNHQFSRHFHDHFVIEFVLEGADAFYCNGKDQTAVKEQLVMINPGEVHTGSTVSGTPLKYFSFYPDHDKLTAVADALQIPFARDFSFANVIVENQGLARKFKALFHSFQSGDQSSGEELFFDCMQSILQPHIVTPELLTEERGSDRRIAILIEFIRDHFKENISLLQMAELVCLNPSHLARLFRRKIGVSPYEYLLILRVEYARRLLRSGQRVKEAALEAGFYDASHFSRSFRKIAGMSPKFFLSSKGQYCTIFDA
jgi:AraC-like DNA-binding protein